MRLLVARADRRPDSGRLRGRPAEVQRSAAGAVGLAVLGAGAPWEVGETASWCRVLVEVTSQQEARTAAAGGAHGLIARGMESGGRVSDLSTFVLLQQLLEDGTVSLPVWAAGGIGLRTAAACVLGGAAGVVLDSQLALMPESELPGDVMRVLRRLDGSETVMSRGRRGLRVVGRPARIAGPRDPDEDTTLLPVGQDGQLAATFAARWRDTASAVRGIRSAILETAADDVAGHALAPGAPLASALGVRVPVAQGPMTRVSDQAGFAAAVAEDGAMPFIALALADGERSRRMLAEVAAALGEHPWGVGVLGFVPEELRAAQLEVILDVKPAWAIVAGGRPAQAKELEQAGIAAFLHVPSPGLLRQFLGSGVRRFVFEGAECGGHIGPRASFPLWEAQIEVIEEFLDTRPAEDGAQVQVLFAGGIHSGRSAAMVAAMAAPLTRRGARIGVLMGTAYLFTQEALDHGAIVPLFQRMALEADGTALLETSPGHVTRALRTPFVDEFARQRAELEAAGTESRDIWMRLEMLNTGRLRLASKGLEHDGAEIDEATQAAEGLYMAGQIAVLRDAVTTVPALHAEVTTGASGFPRHAPGRAAAAGRRARRGHGRGGGRAAGHRDRRHGGRVRRIRQPGRLLAHHSQRPGPVHRGTRRPLGPRDLLHPRFRGGQGRPAGHLQVGRFPAAGPHRPDPLRHPPERPGQHRSQPAAGAGGREPGPQRRRVLATTPQAPTTPAPGSCSPRNPAPTTAARWPCARCCRPTWVTCHRNWTSSCPRSRRIRFPATCRTWWRAASPTGSISAARTTRWTPRARPPSPRSTWPASNCPPAAPT